MIGNDIVCTSKKPFKNRIARLEEKILCTAEYELLNEFNSGKRIALVWSVKEAAFKCCNRHFDYDFVPAEFCIHEIVMHPAKNKNVRFSRKKYIEGKGFGDFEHFACSVNTPAGRVVARSIIGPGFVLTIAAAYPEDADTIFWGVKKINETDYKSQSIQVRECIIDSLIKRKWLHEGEGYSFSKIGTVPCLYVNSKKSEMLMSFSHDDKFVAYAYLLPK